MKLVNLVSELSASFSADVVLEKEPWLNTTTACTFPFGSNKRKEQIDQTNDTTFSSDVKHDTLKFDGHPSKKVDRFLGQYGNFAYVNLTVTVNDTLEELILNFDVYSCAVKNVTGEREDCVGLGIYWFLSLWSIKLDDENNPSQFVDVTFTPTEGPVRFERDLLFEDAPGPRDHWPQCDQLCRSDSSQRYQLNEVQIVILSAIIRKLV